MVKFSNKAPSIIGALTVCGEIVLAVTIPAAAFMAGGVGFPSVPTAVAAPAQVIQTAASVVDD